MDRQLLARAARLARRAAGACHDDRVDGLAAEFAFFGVLSTFPGLLVVAALLGSLERLVGHDLATFRWREALPGRSRWPCCGWSPRSASACTCASRPAPTACSAPSGAR